ncbi:MAG: hypothetical protein V3U02_01070, partial [Calditrichia bacterium]
LIRTVDKIFFKDMNNKEHRKIFIDKYEWLSEFCHPNHFGQIIGVVLKGKRAIFNQKHELEVSEISPFRTALNSSCCLFFYMYDECFSLIEKHEEMPHLAKYK